MNIKWLLAAGFSFFLTRQCTAQKMGDYKGSFDIGIYTGANFFFGDVGGNNGIGKRFIKDLDLSNTKGLFGITGAYNFSDNLSLRINSQISSAAAQDSKLNPDDGSGRYYRNLSFKSTLSEASIGLQYYLRRYSDNALNEYIVNKVSYTFFAGIGLFHFDPKSYYKDNWIRLEPLRTEGQGMSEYPDRKPYKLTQLYVPFSAGVNYQLNEAWSVRGELMFRKTFTDYIDDVSTGYIDPIYFDKYLAPGQASLARALYNRSGEINGGINMMGKNEIRGKSNKDTWVSFNIGVVYNLSL